MAPRTRYAIAGFGFVCAILLLGIGMVVLSMMQWRLHLLTSLWLLSLLPRALITQRAAPGVHGIARLSLIVVLSFVAVALQLGREQIGQASTTRIRVAQLREVGATAPDQATALRPGDRTALGNGRIWPVMIGASVRGTIRDRNGVVLAETRDGRRIYPFPDLGNIIGFQSRLYGNSGVEAARDLDLSGTRTFSVTALLESRLLGTPFTTQPADVYLTLDATLQQAAQAALGDRPGAVVVLDPRTGAILALATYPRFDPNQLVLADTASAEQVAQVQAFWQGLTERSDSPLLNRATQGRYPPGSVIKTLTAAAALDSGLLTGPEAQVTCPNRLNTDAGAPPVVNAVENLAQRTGDPSDLRRVYAWSCNTAFAQIGLGLGAERFADYAGRFGLGFADAPAEPALLDIPAEAGTIANDPAFLQRPVALADTSFGQGQALVTPLDMAQMVALVANNGILMRPYLVQDVRVGDQIRSAAKPTIIRQAINIQAAAQLRDVMRSSVEFGYAKPVALPGITIGAKTGTAEAPGGAPHSWFVAIAPLEQPRFAIAVIVEHGGEGSRNALPIARQVLAAALGVQP
ncbi:MAG: penicillin-binding protein 2 [Roseiflexaceae bacterium]|nr:penicillin-binding protein 2 [Roseiflexaceae bacterium]